MLELLDSATSSASTATEDFAPEVQPASISAWPSGVPQAGIEYFQVQIAPPPRWETLPVLFAEPPSASVLGRVEPQLDAALSVLERTAPRDLPAPLVEVPADGVARLHWRRPGHELVLTAFSADGTFTGEFRRAGAGVTSESLGPVELGSVADWLSAFAPTRAYEFLRGLADPNRGEPLLAPDTAKRAERLLRRILGALPLLHTPAVGPGPDGMVGLTWESPGHHVNVEVFPDGHLELFHENLRSGVLWSDDEAQDITPALLGRLRELSEDA